MSNVNFNGNNQSSSSGGGDATAANQVLEISELQNLLLELQSFANQNNVDLTAVISNLNGSISSTNVLVKEASFQKLIQDSVAAGFTNLYDLLVALTNINTGKSTAANQTTTNTFLNLINNGINSLITSTDNNVFGALKGIEGANQLYVRANTNSTITIRCDFQTVNNLAQKKYLNLQIEANAGATGTINVEVRNSSTAPYIVVPLIDKQATFAAAFLNPPFNVAGAKMYQLDVSGYYDVRFTFSIPSASYFINYSTSVN